MILRKYVMDPETPAGCIILESFLVDYYGEFVGMSIESLSFYELSERIVVEYSRGENWRKGTDRARIDKDHFDYKNIRALWDRLYRVYKLRKIVNDN